MADDRHSENLRLAVKEFARIRKLRVKNPTLVAENLAARYKLTLEELDTAWSKYYLSLHPQEEPSPKK